MAVPKMAAKTLPGTPGDNIFLAAYGKFPNLYKHLYNYGFLPAGRFIGFWQPLTPA